MTIWKDTPHGHPQEPTWHLLTPTQAVLDLSSTCGCGANWRILAHSFLIWQDSNNNKHAVTHTSKKL